MVKATAMVAALAMAKAAEKAEESAKEKTEERRSSVVRDDKERRSAGQEREVYGAMSNERQESAGGRGGRSEQ